MSALPGSGRTSAGVYRPPLYSPIYVPRVTRPVPWRPQAHVAMRTGLLLADVVAIAGSLAAIRGVRALVFGEMPISPAILVGALLWFLLRAESGLYSVQGMAPPEELRRSTLTTVLAGLVHASVLFVIQQAHASRFIALGGWVLLAVASWAARQVVKAVLVRRGLFGLPVVIIGGGNTAKTIIRELHGSPSLGLRPVAVFDDDPGLHGEAIEGVPVIGPIGAALTYAFPYPVSYALITLPDSPRSNLVDLSHRFAGKFPYVGIVPDLLGLASLWVRPRNIGPVLTLEYSHDRFHTWALRLKRLFDLLVGLPIFLTVLPVIATCAAMVKLFSPGPAFYAQLREGLGGRMIKVWKIRTMVPDAEKRLEEYLAKDDLARRQWERCMKLQKDPRVIPVVGPFLRRWSLDELPQIWNVLTGNMSLVGPRPFPEYHLAKFPKEFRSLRHQVPPGITGFWQVTDRSETDLGRQEAADAYYIHNWSLWLDVWILLRTAQAVVAGNGAY